MRKEGAARGEWSTKVQGAGVVERESMGIILSLSRRKGKKAEEAARERQKKVDELCEMFPMLDKVRFVVRFVGGPVKARISCSRM